MADEHRKRVELNRRGLQMRTMIAGYEDSIAPQQLGGGGAARSATDHLMFKKLKLHSRTEAAEMENVGKMEVDPAEEAALAAEVEAALAEPMEVATEEATAEEVPAQVQVFFMPPT